MIECYNCDNTALTKAQKLGVTEFKGIKNLEFRYETYECDSCGASVNDSDQQKIKVTAISDAYRSHKGLYTSLEIRKFREDMQMSQDKFADYLGVGVASIRRWEGAGIQDLSQNEVIRLKCDEASFENQLIEQWQNKAPSEFTGFRQFNIARLAAIFAKFNSFAASPLFFFKALFYVDIHHFLNSGVSVTGLNYECLEYGPIPKNYGIIRDYLKRNYATSIVNHDIIIKNIFDEKLFCDSELQSIHYVEDILRSKGKEYIFKQVHDHQAFKENDYLESISYNNIAEINI